MPKYILTQGSFRVVDDDELAHFKYIKRIRQNGRWVYFYDKASADKELNAIKQEMLNNQKEAFEASKQQRSANKAMEGYDEAGYIKKLILKDNQRRAEENSLSKTKNAEKLYKKYESVKLKQIREKKIVDGVNLIKKFFSGLISKRGESDV